MTIDIITALDQAFFQAETAQNDQVRTQAIQHFINVAGIMEQQLQVAGIKEVRIGGKSVVAVPTEQLARQMEAQLPPKLVRTYQTGVHGLGDPGLRWTPSAAAERPMPPACRVGDILEYTGKNAPFFTKGDQYEIVSVSANGELVGIKSKDDFLLSLGKEDLLKFINRGQPAPDVIDMTDPRNWQKGDVLLRSDRVFPHFKPGEECIVTYSSDTQIWVAGSAGVDVVYTHGVGEPASNFFTWLRHGDAPPQA